MVAFGAGILAAQAADPIFPTGFPHRAGAAARACVSPTFPGFEDAGDKAAIMLATFPAEAFSSLDKSMVPEALAKQGIDEARAIQAEAGKGFLLTGKQTIGDASFREWMLIAPAGDVTALVTVRIPDQDTKLYRSSGARGAGDASGARQRSRCRTAEPVAVHGRRPGRFSHRRRVAGPRFDAGRIRRPGNPRTRQPPTRTKTSKAAPSRPFPDRGACRADRPNPKMTTSSPA